jgi:tRNA(fMet)-specific endonuclease VapC
VTLSVDTSVLVEVLRNRNHAVRSAFASAIAGSEPVVTSLIVFHELMFSAVRHRDPAAERVKVRRVLSQLGIEALDARDVTVAAEIREALSRRGAPIGPYDLLIAGQALARGWTIVTNNTREFNRIDGLKVVDWLEA